MECVLLDFWLHLGSASLSCIFSLSSFRFSPTHPWSNPPPLPPHSWRLGWGCSPVHRQFSPCVFLIRGKTQSGDQCRGVGLWVGAPQHRRLQAASLGLSVYTMVLPPPPPPLLLAGALLLFARASSSLAEGRFRPLLRAESSCLPNLTPLRGGEDSWGWAVA